MKDQFPGYVRPAEQEIKRYWREGLFVPDANVLLDLYRVSDATRADLFAAFEALGDRLWVPHQAAFEYHRSRYKVILERRSAPARIEDLVDEAEGKLVEALESHERAQLRDPDAAEFGDVAKEHFADLREDLAEREKARQESAGIDASLDVDPIYDELSDLLEGRLGPSSSDERLAEIYAEGEKRYEEQVPPGFSDAGKAEPGRYGDLVLWRQIIEKALEVKKPIILVTGDAKEDWVWRIGGQTIGPRPELVQEMADLAQVPFYLYPTHRFLEFARSELGLRDVTDEAIEEVRQTQPDDAPATDPLTLGEFSRFREPMETTTGRPRLHSPQHEEADEGVTLTIGLDDVEGTSVLACKVTSPSGKIAVSTITLEPGTIRVAFPYPRSFRGATELRTGRFQVRWSLFGGTEADSPVVRDTFVID